MIKEVLSKMFRKVADDIDSGNCNMSEAEMLSVFEQIKDLNAENSHLSKYEACECLGISRATFDRYVAEGKLPQGKKRAGFKELYWKKSELKI